MIGNALSPRLMRALAVLLTPVLALTMASCGTGESQPASADGTSKARVASIGMTPASVDLTWAVEGGLFKRHGLDLTLNPPTFSPSDLVNTVLSGDADFALVSHGVVANARHVGKPLVIVATTQAPYPLQLAFTPEKDKELRDQGLSESSSVDELFAALSGMTLGTNPTGSSITASYRYLMEEYGINPERDNITLQPMPELGAQVAALGNGRVDGLLSALGGASTGAAAQGTGVVWDLRKMEGADSLEEIPMTSVVTSEQVIKNKPEVVQSFLEALHEAQRDMLEGLPTEDARTVKGLVAPDMEEDAYNEILSGILGTYQKTFVTTEAFWEASVKVAEVDASESLDAAYGDAVDNSFAEKIE